MRVIDLAIKDLRQIIRDRKSLLFLVVMPIFFTFFMGLAFRPSTPGDTRLRVGWWPPATGVPLADEFRQLLSLSSAVRPVDVEAADLADAERQVLDGDLAGLLIVPDNLVESAMAGNTPQFVLVTDVGGAAPSRATTANTLQQSVQGALDRFLGALEAARLTVEQIQATRPFADEETRRAVFLDAVAEAAGAWQEAPVVLDVEQVTVRNAAETQGPTSFEQASPGMIVQFAIFGLVTSAMVLALERKTRTLQRLLTTAMSRAEIIGGHILAMFLVVMLQEAVLIAFGQFALDVNYARAPLATLLVTVALAFWVSTLGLLIGTITRTEDEVVLYSLVAMFLFTALGGAWFPLEGVGPTFRAIGQLTPTAWAMQGFQNIIVRGMGLSSAFVPAGILAAYGVVFFAIAVWRFRFETA